MVTMENSGEVSQKIKIEVSYDPVILPLGMYLKEMKILCWSDSCTLMFIIALLILARKVKATQVYTDGWMDKQNVAYTHNGILFSL